MENKVYLSTDFLNNLLYDATLSNPRYNLLSRSNFTQGYIDDGRYSPNNYAVVDKNFYFVPSGDYTLSFDFNKGSQRQFKVAMYTEPDEASYIGYVQGGWITGQPNTITIPNACYIRITVRVSSSTTVNADNLKYVQFLSGENTVFEIMKQPSNFIGNLGETAYFTIKVAGATAYQWQYSQDNGATWVNGSLSGYATPTYIVPITSGRLGMLFRCMLTNGNSQTKYTNVCKIILAK